MSRLFLHGLQAALFALGRRRPITGPTKLAWEVTEACNSRCLTCNRRETPAPGELTTEEGFRLIDDIAALGTMTLSFSGGEPLVRPDFPRLVSRAVERGLSTSVSTNGLLLKGRRLEELLDAGIHSIYISLDGATPETNDRLRGIPGSHGRVLQAAETIIAERRGKRPRVYFNTTVSRANLSELPDIATLANERGLDGLTVQPAQVFTEARLAPNPELVLSSSDASSLKEALDEIRCRYPGLIPLPGAYLDGMDDFLMDPHTMKRIPCIAGLLHGVIGSTGTVYPCPVEFASMGSVKNESIAAVWSGEKARTVRRRIATGDHPPCWFNCIIPASLVLNDIFPFGWLRFLSSPASRHLFTRLQGSNR